jgi:TonB family protein
MPALLAPAEVYSDPPGAMVTVDGRQVGLAPQKLDLGPGLHEIKLELDGFAPAVKHVEVHPGVKMVVRTRLDSKPAEIAAIPAASPVATPVLPGALVMLDDTVTPPRRVAGGPALYPKDARRLNAQGTVEVEFTVDEKGTPRDVVVLHSAGAVLDEAVIEAIYKFRYTPAGKDGVPVKVRQTYRQKFP